MSLFTVNVTLKITLSFRMWENENFVFMALKFYWETSRATSNFDDAAEHAFSVSLLVKIMQLLSSLFPFKRTCSTK